LLWQRQRKTNNFKKLQKNIKNPKKLKKISKARPPKQDTPLFKKQRRIQFHTAKTRK